MTLVVELYKFNNNNNKSSKHVNMNIEYNIYEYRHIYWNSSHWPILFEFITIL